MGRLRLSKTTFTAKYGNRIFEEGGNTYDRIGVVHRGLCSHPGNHHDCRYHCLLPDDEKMTPALTAALLEAFTKGAALTVSVYLFWKKRNEESMPSTYTFAHPAEK